MLPGDLPRVCSCMDASDRRGGIPPGPPGSLGVGNLRSGLTNLGVPPKRALMSGGRPPGWIPGVLGVRGGVGGWSLVGVPGAAPKSEESIPG